MEPSVCLVPVPLFVSFPCRTVLTLLQLKDTLQAPGLVDRHFSVFAFPVIRNGRLEKHDLTQDHRRPEAVAEKHPVTESDDTFGTDRPGDPERKSRNHGSRRLGEQQFLRELDGKT